MVEALEVMKEARKIGEFLRLVPFMKKHTLQSFLIGDMCPL